jgi:CheY-like chemotaxis protein
MLQPLRRVIIIEDDYISLYLINKLLREKNIAETILPFTNGIEALNYLLKNAKDFSELPEFILLDMKMPEINGWQFLQELNKIEFVTGYQPVVCIVSAEITVDFNLLNTWSCVKGYLQKPILPNKLIKVIQSLSTKVETDNTFENTLEREIA